MTLVAPVTLFPKPPPIIDLQPVVLFPSPPPIKLEYEFETLLKYPLAIPDQLVETELPIPPAIVA